MIVNDYYNEIRKKYLITFDEDLPIETRKIAARNVVEQVVDSIFDRKQIADSFKSINRDRREYNNKLGRGASDDRKYVFRDSFRGKIEFLTEFNHISRNLKHAFLFIYGESSDYGDAHSKFGKGNDSFIDGICLFLNEILSDYYLKNKKKPDYLIPFPETNILGSQEIETTLNIRKDQTSLLKKYRTLLAYIFGFLFTLFPVLSLPILSIGFYKTKTEVKKRNVKRNRNFIFSLMLVLTLAWLFFSTYNLYDVLGNDLYAEPLEQSNRIGFNPDPAQSNLGFFSINDDTCRTCANIKDIVKVPSLKVGESFNFIVCVDYHNWGNVTIENPKTAINFPDPEDDNLRITAKLFGSNVPTIFDTAMLTNLPDSYDIEVRGAYMTNIHGQTMKGCEGYSYRIEVLDFDNMDKGIPLTKLDTKNDGWCGQGIFLAKYSIINTGG